MQRYEERLSAYQAVDFDDLIGLPLDSCCNATPRSRAKWQHTLRATCWSTSTRTPTRVQYELLKALVGERGACSPRWATTTRASTAGAARRSTTCKRLPQDFPTLKVIALEQNYRSTGAHPARRQPR